MGVLRSLLMWVLSSLTMIDRVHWIDKDKFARFILDCQVFTELIDIFYSL